MKRQNGLRKGNVLVVVGITSVVGVIATSAMFMANSGRRAEKRAELKEKAFAIANSALEETILKIMNNSAGFVVPQKGEAHIKESHIPAATIMMYEPVGGVRVDPVKLYARRLEVPTHNDTERNRFYGFLMLGPRFATNHNPNWRSSITDPRISKLMALPDGVKPSEEATRELRALVPDNMIPTDRVAKELAKLTPIPAGQEGRDPQKPSAAAQSLADQLQGAPQERITKTASEVQVSCGVAAPPSGLVGAMAMVALGEESANGAKATGAQADAAKAQAAATPGGLMQEPVKLNATLLASLLKSGCMDRDTFLVTLEGKASVERAGITVEAPLTTNRVVEQSRFDHVGTFAYGQFLAYLHVHYNLSFEDMQALNWVNKNGQVVPDNVFPELIAKNNLRTNPQPWPFQISRTAMLRT